MYSVLAIGFGVVVIGYVALQVLLHATQSKGEPQLLETAVPFLDSAIGIAIHKVNYLVKLKNKYRLPIQTLRMPFQRVYVVNGSSIIQEVQSKANAKTFVPNLLDFGMMFSGLNKTGKEALSKAVGHNGNNFTISIHKYLQGSYLQVATHTAITRLASSVANSFADFNGRGLAEILRHDLCLAMTSAVYGPENPFDDAKIESSWLAFVPGINHLLYSPAPLLTAWKALRARSRVIDGFRKYFETGGHLQAFPMVAEMYKINLSNGLSPGEASKLEMATALAMLSSGGITAFWLMFHILSNIEALAIIRQELLSIVKTQSDGVVKVLDLSMIKDKCPKFMAMMHETLRYHSTVINIKKVQHDTVLSKEKYQLKKDGIVMIPGKGVHHDTAVWGQSADSFDHRRFLSVEGQKKLSNTLAYRPFGAGVTMCPGRHFSLNVILSLTAMALLQFDIAPKNGKWVMPTKKNGDMWNAMPKPDHDIEVDITPRKDSENTEWKFIWGEVEKTD